MDLEELVFKFFFSGIARHWVVPLPAELSRKEERGKGGGWPPFRILNASNPFPPSFSHMWYYKAYYSLEGFVLNKNVLEVSSEGKKMSSQTAEGGVNFSHRKKQEKKEIPIWFPENSDQFFCFYFGWTFLYKKTSLRRRSNCPLSRF